MKSGRKAIGSMCWEEIDRSTLPPVKTGITLSAEAHYRLRAGCTHFHKDQSELIEWLVMQHLGNCFTSVRKPGSGPAEGAA